MATPADLQAIYLRDHQAGAAAGLELFRRAAGHHRGTATGVELERLTAEVAQDREALIGIAHSLGVGEPRLKVVLGWVGEKAMRLKANGHLITRSPLSDLVELEALQLGVLGKGAGWRTLQVWAGSEQRLDGAKLRELEQRAEHQAAALERLRMEAAERLVGS